MKPLLKTKLTRQLETECKRHGLYAEIIELNNISVNGDKRGCSGFITNTQDGSCIYIRTEKSAYAPLADLSLYRYARDNKDYSSNGLSNGQNHWATDNDLASAVIKLLLDGRGEPKM